MRLESPASWDEVSAGWERRRSFVWAASHDLGERLVDLLGPGPGDTVLEVAAGPGDTGLLAAQRIRPGGRLLSTDVSPGMVEAARRRAGELGITNAEFRRMDAQALELPDASVDGVVCRWGYMLVDDPAAALTEARRVLRRDGRVAFAVWASAEENPWASALGRILVEHGLIAPPEPDAPGPFRLADPDRLRRLVAAAGLELLVLEDVALTWRYGSFDEYWAITSDLSRTLATALENLEEPERSAVRDRVRGVLSAYETDSGLSVPGKSRVVLALRP